MKHFYLKRPEYITRFGSGTTVQYKPFGCVAMTKENDEVVASFSLCSPSDQWSKHIARTMARGRLNKRINGIERAHAITVNPGDRIENVINDYFKEGLNIQRLYDFKNADLVELNRFFQSRISDCLENA
jgi:hypothetical protein